jgi:hypothetical protein
MAIGLYFRRRNKARSRLLVGVEVDGDVIFVISLVNVYIHAGTRVVFFDDNRTSLFYYDLRRRRGRGWGGSGFGGGGRYRRRRLLAGGDSE